MSEKNKEDFTNLEQSLRKALSSEKKMGLSPSQLNSLHLMISKENHSWKGSRWMNWLVPSSILATALVAIIVVERYPETGSISKETATPWIQSESTKSTTMLQESEQRRSLSNEGTKKGTSPKKPSAIPAEPASGRIAESGKYTPDLNQPKPGAGKIADNKTWESKRTGSKNPSPSVAGEATRSALGLADLAKGDLNPDAHLKSESYFGASAKKGGNRSKTFSQPVSIVKTSSLSSKLTESLNSKITGLQNCSPSASIWQIRFKILKSGGIENLSAIPISGNKSSTTKSCISEEVKGWTFKSNQQSQVDFKVKFGAELP